MIKVNLKDDNQSSKYINKDEISTLQVKYNYGSKSVIVNMKNGETFEIYYNEENLEELSS